MINKLNIVKSTSSAHNLSTFNNPFITITIHDSTQNGVRKTNTLCRSLLPFRRLRPHHFHEKPPPPLHAAGPSCLSHHRPFTYISSAYASTRASTIFPNATAPYIVQLYLGSVPCVLVSTPELAKEFLKTNEYVFSSRKRSTAIDIVTYESSFAFSPYGPYWKYIKKLCTYELLGARNLNHFQPIRNFEVKSFLGILMKKGKSGEIVNVTEELVKLTSNVISHMMLSIRCSGMGGEAEAARTVVREVTKIFGEFDVSDIIGFAKSLDLQGLRKRSEDIQRRYDALLEKIISERERLRRSGGGGGEARDFLDTLLDILESGKAEVQFTRDHIKALVLVRILLHLSLNLLVPLLFNHLMIICPHIHIRFGSSVLK